MDLESFLELEKRQLTAERQLLNEQSYNKFYSLTPAVNTNASMTIENKKTKLNEETSLCKKSKDCINKQFDDDKIKDVDDTRNYLKKKQQMDDMEQWVSDTFYSYFPGFNNEYQKRQIELQKRQRENQENLIKHQMLNNKQSKNKKHLNMEASNFNSAHSNNSSLTSNDLIGSTLNSGQNDFEITSLIKPDCIQSKHSNHFLPPDSARYKLLQDLCHTNLTNLVSGGTEDPLETNRRKIEIESARKKEYQRELMQQIEEKRRTIKLLRDKEHQQEEVLTRRLQEQLRTMKLEEQLEKERIKAVKARFDTEQNRLAREHLLAKLENDAQLITGADLNKTDKKPASLNSEADKENLSDKQDNKVYKYFSNSGKSDYNYRNKNSTLPTEIDLELAYSEMAKIERECFHLSEKICPMCDEPLKELENFCLRCQSKISFRIRSPGKRSSEKFNIQKTKTAENDDTECTVPHDSESDRSFFLVCVRCERLYSWCKTCIYKVDLCRACQNKRNLCMACRKTLCSFCLEEVACGKDSETLHLNDSIHSFQNKTIRKENSSNEMSFQIINNNEDGVKNDNKSANISSMSAKYPFNNLCSTNNPPYSMNIDQNSIFHPENLKAQSAEEENSTFCNKDFTLNTSESDDKNIERLRRETDKKLARYIKNYGDLVFQTKGTQTTPTTSSRRDIVIQGQHSLSIPLLREMPKMIRNDAFKTKGSSSKEMDDLQGRWDIPAVQKYTISPTSPKVVTQVGAMRRELQVDKLFSKETNS